MPSMRVDFYAFDPFLFLLTLVAGKSLLRPSSGCTWLALLLSNFRGLGSMGYVEVIKRGSIGFLHRCETLHAQRKKRTANGTQNESPED